MASAQVFLVTVVCFVLTSAKIYRLKGSTVVFTCKFNGGIIWSYRKTGSDSWTTYSSNSNIANVDVQDRLSLTGDSSIGEYKLNIRDLQERDTGYYLCKRGGGGDGDIEQLVVIVGPTNVQINKKTPNNTLEGTEGQNLQIQCTATGGYPTPDVKLLISGNQVVTSKGSVSYELETVDRLLDGQNVTCLAGYTSVNDFPLSDSVDLYLRLNPIVPTYDKTSVSVIEGHPVDITCTSTGSRPAALFIWELGSADISNSSQITSSILDQTSNTFAVISRLRFTLSKDHNGQLLKCKATNAAAPNGVMANGITVNVKYPPTVMVEDKTFTEETVATVLTCKADGNPDTYTFYEWTHESLQGTFIRKLNGSSDGNLTLPYLNKTLRYQNTGRYNCTVGNDIPDTATRRTGSGVLTLNAPPVFSLYNSWTQGGEIRKSVNISVYVYSVPTLLRTVWYQGNTQVSDSGYRISYSQTTVSLLFHWKEIEVDGFKLTLNINEVKDSDFTTYRLVVNNSRGSTEQNIVFQSNSAPDPPKNLSVVDQTEESITIQWVEGYDGGYEQTFFVLYRPKGAGMWKTWTGPKGQRGSSNKLHQTQIDGLQHSTTYEIKMFAENQINKSSDTMVEIGVTDTKSDGSSTGAVIGGVAGGLSVVVIMLIVVVVIMKLRNRSASGKRDSTSKLSDGTESETEEGLKENIIYESSGPEIKKSTAPMYAEVIKNKNSAPVASNDVYSEVKKAPMKKSKAPKAPKGKKKAKDKSKKNVFNNNPDGEYGNSDLPLKRISNEYANAEDVQGKMGHKNADGLEYADLSFTKPSKTAKLVIHGEDRTIYSDIDLTKVAPPPPQESAYEDTTIGQAKTK